MTIVSIISGNITDFIKKLFDFFSLSSLKGTTYILSYTSCPNGSIDRYSDYTVIRAVLFELEKHTLAKKMKTRSIVPNDSDSDNTLVFYNIPVSKIEYDGMIFNHVTFSKETNSVNTLEIYSEKRDKKYIMTFLKKCYDDFYIFFNSKSQSFYTVSYKDTHSYKRYDFVSKTSFDNMYFPSKKMIIDHLDLLKNKKIPKLGILFHGSPGTGKTSCIKAIANYTKRSIIEVKLKNINNKEQLIDLFFSKELGKFAVPLSERIYVFEDIDCDSVSLDRNQKNEKDKDDNKTMLPSLSLSDILNCLDGILELKDVIIIMTTNHVKKLDEALIRPGRIDLKIQFEKLDIDSINKTIKHHFNDTIPAKYIKEISGCELDNMIKTSENLKELEEKFKSK